MTHYLMSLLSLLNAVSPYLLLGFLFAGLLHVYVPRHYYADYLSGRNFRSVLYSTLFGIPLPLCSCGVLPTAMSLRSEGASRGATVAFLIATPQTGVDSILATYSLLGLPFAILRPIAALLSGIFGGVFVNLFDSKEPPTSASSSDAAVAGLCNDDCCDNHENVPRTMREVLRYGFVEMFGNIGKWLLIGLLVAGLITVFVPSQFIAQYADIPLLNMVVVVLLAVPMYLCATGSIPIAAALMLKGLSPGAALVLLMAGPAANAASLFVVGRVMGRKTLALYLLSIVGGSMTIGLFVDYCLPAAWFALPASVSGHTHMSGSWFVFECLCSVVLIGLCINAYFHKKSHREEIGTMEQVYQIEGMHCSHCQATVEKAIGGVRGVSQVRVDLERGVAIVTGNADVAAIGAAVEAVGFVFKG